MHPRQASVVHMAHEIAEKVAAKADKPAAGPAVLWKYVDPEGKEFYLTEKKLTVKSPYSGKSFTTKPEKMTGAKVQQELRDESKGGGGPGPKTTGKKKASDWKL